MKLKLKLKLIAALVPFLLVGCSATVSTPPEDALTNVAEEIALNGAPKDLVIRYERGNANMSDNYAWIVESNIPRKTTLYPVRYYCCYANGPKGREDAQFFSVDFYFFIDSFGKWSRTLHTVRFSGPPFFIFHLVYCVANSENESTAVVNEEQRNAVSIFLRGIPRDVITPGPGYGTGYKWGESIKKGSGPQSVAQNQSSEQRGTPTPEGRSAVQTDTYTITGNDVLISRDRLSLARLLTLNVRKDKSGIRQLYNSLLQQQVVFTVTAGTNISVENYGADGIDKIRIGGVRSDYYVADVDIKTHASK